MAGFFQEFRQFAMRGNVVDLAVGVVIGGAFGKIVASLVADLLTPPLGLLLGGVDFSALAVTLKAAEGAAPAVQLAYGKFLQAIIDFVIIALAVFALVRTINRLQQPPPAPPPPPAAPPPPSAEARLLGEIRDLLKSGR